MDSQYAPRLRSARTVCRVLSKRPNDVAARLDQLIKIVRIRITSGYGKLLLRGAELNAVHSRIPRKAVNLDGCAVHDCSSVVYGYEALVTFVLENKHLDDVGVLLKRCR